MQDVLRHIDPCHVEYSGQKMLFFGGYDYLNLSFESAVREALVDTLHSEGMSVRSSRATTGEHELFLLLEREFAEFTGMEEALLFPGAYLANQVLITEILLPGSRVYLEKNAHSSLSDALAGIRAEIITFEMEGGGKDGRDGRDGREEREEREERGESVTAVLLEGMKSVSGGPLDTDRLLQHFPPGQFNFILDESHSFGMRGAGGRGYAADLRKAGADTIMVVSLSKVLGSYGAMIAGSPEIIRKIRNSNAFRGSSALPLPQCAASRAALGLLKSHPQWPLELAQKSYKFKQRLKEAGLKIEVNDSPIIIFGSEAVEKDELINSLLEKGIYHSFIRYPGGPADDFFRFSLSRLHLEEHQDKLFGVLSNCRK